VVGLIDERRTVRGVRNEGSMAVNATGVRAACDDDDETGATGVECGGDGALASKDATSSLLSRVVCVVAGCCGAGARMAAVREEEEEEEEEEAPIDGGASCRCNTRDGVRGTAAVRGV